MIKSFFNIRLSDCGGEEAVSESVGPAVNAAKLFPRGRQGESLNKVI